MGLRTFFHTDQGIEQIRIDTAVDLRKPGAEKALTAKVLPDLFGNNPGFLPSFHMGGHLLLEIAADGLPENLMFLRVVFFK